MDKVGGLGATCIVGIDAHIRLASKGGGDAACGEAIIFMVRLSDRCCDRIRHGRKELQFKLGTKEVRDSDDDGVYAATLKLCQRIEDHKDGKLGPGACRLDFDPSRDTWGLSYVMAEVTRELAQGGEGPGLKRTINGSVKKPELLWAEGSGYGNSKSKKSQHKLKALHFLNNLVRANKQEPGDKMKLKDLLGNIASDFQWKAFVSDKDVAMERRCSLRFERGLQMLQMVRKKKPSATELTAAGTYVASIAPGSDATAKDWKSFSRDLGYRDVRKVKWVWDSIQMRHELDVYNVWAKTMAGKEIPVGTRVSTNYGPGVLKSKTASGGVVVTMEATGMSVTFKSAGRRGARMRLLAPSIVYQRDHGRQNQPKAVEARKHRSVMREWLVKNNFPSPNTRDTMRRRRGWRQVESAQKIYRFQSWDELWAEFRRDQANQSTVEYVGREWDSDGAKDCRERASTLFVKARPWFLVKERTRPYH